MTMTCNAYVPMFLVFLLAFFDGVLGGDYCFNGYRTEYCSHGCCNGDCCTADVALIVGLVLGGIALIITIIVIVCCYRRRVSHGVVYRQNAAATVITHSTVTASGTNVMTPGVQPGYAYPAPAPYGYPQGVVNQAYPNAQPNPNTMAPPAYEGVVGPNYPYGHKQ